jgi:hypothetical protein
VLVIWETGLEIKAKPPFTTIVRNFKIIIVYIMKVSLPTSCICDLYHFLKYSLEINSNNSMC